jgi:excisionase family DNA binding protein
VPEAARRLGLSEKTVHRAIRRGEITAIRIGRRSLVLREPFEELLRGRGGDPTN